MTSSFYGYAALFETRPAAEDLAALAARVAEKHLPEIANFEYRLSDTLPVSFPEMAGIELLRRKAGLGPESVILLVYPASTGRHTPNHGTLTR